MDHDQRLKTLLQRFLGSFFDAFLPDWSHRFDFGRVEWLENEVFSDPPEGQRHVLDLVAKLPLVDAAGLDIGDVAEAFIVLIQIEVESGDSIAKFRRRQFRYYANLRQKYDLPVLPVAVFLRVGLNGLGVDAYRESWGPLETLRFTYCYVGLPKLDAVEYLQTDNPAALSLMGLMKVPAERAGELRAEAMRKIADLVHDDYGRFLLTECIDAYWSLSDDQRRDYDRLMAEPEYEEARTMATTTFEKGIETGIEKGIEKGQSMGRRQMLIEFMRDRFGPLPDDLLARLNSLPDSRIPELRHALAQALPLADVVELLNREEPAAGNGHSAGQ